MKGINRRGKRGPDKQPRQPGGGRKPKPEAEKVKTYGVQLTEAENAAILAKYGSRTRAIKSLILNQKPNIMEQVTNQQAAKVLDNAFIINRKGTKHRKEFVGNTFERPCTYYDFFQLLHYSGINLTSYDAMNYMCHLKATDYVNNWRGGVKLVIGSGFAHIEVEAANHLNITLNRGAIIDKLQWFADQSLFHTDFGELKHAEGYYL